MKRGSREVARIKNYGGMILLFVALGWVIVSVVIDDSYGKLLRVQTATDQQKQRNAEANHNNQQLRRRIHDLQESSRELEKTARNEMGLARPDEMIFFFEESKRK